MIIGVIDSGIDRDFLDRGTTILSDTRFIYKCSESKVLTQNEYSVSDLHGTLVLNTVEKYKGNTENQYIVCNVYDENGVAHVEAVLAALRYLATTEVEMIVISLTVNPKYKDSCGKELEQLHRKGVRIFASFSNEGKPSGLLDNPYVYGIDRLPVQAAQRWQMKCVGRQIFADARPELICVGNGRWAVFHGTSKANAMVAGLYCGSGKVKSRKKPKDVVEKTEYRPDDVSRSRLSKIYDEIRECSCETNEMEYDELLDTTELSEIVCDKNDIATVLRQLAEKHHIDVDYASLPVEMFQDLAGIASFIEYHEKVAAGVEVRSFRSRLHSFVHRYRLNTVVKECVKYLRYNLIQIFVALLCSAFLFITPIIEQHIVDDGIGDKSFKLLCIWAGILVVNAVFQKGLDALNSIVGVRVGNKIEMDLRGRLVERIASVKIDGFSDSDSGKLDTLIKTDFIDFKSIVSSGVLSIVVSLFELVFATVMMLRYNLLLGAVVFVVQVLSLFVIFGQFDTLERSNTYLRECVISQNRVLNDIIINIRWIRLIGAKEYLMKQLRTAMQNKSKQMERTTFVNIKVSSFDNVISTIGSAIMYLLGGYLIIKGNLTMGMLIGFMQYAGKFASPVSGLISEFTSYRSNIAAISDICDYLETSGARYIPDQEVESPSEVKCIEAKNLTFGYEDGKRVFDEANASFSKECINYIVGPSGAGKSTLAQLIVGGYLPQRGMLLVDGTDAKKMENIESLITYAPQKPIILNDSVYNNLALGEEIEEQEIVRICKACCIHDEIMNLPMGYETQMGEAGAFFSGGEMQRVALARALLRNKPILLLDECTSALDENTEIAVRDQIEDELRKRLTIIITHSEQFILPKKSCVFSVQDGKISLEKQMMNE